MKIQLLSDIHLEFDPGYEPPKVDANVTIVDGDIGVGLDGIERAK
jgi:hypothetical protein